MRHMCLLSHVELPNILARQTREVTQGTEKEQKTVDKSSVYKEEERQAANSVGNTKRNFEEKTRAREK